MDEMNFKKRSLDNFFKLDTGRERDFPWGEGDKSQPCSPREQLPKEKGTTSFRE
jgi:hypothetical protein